MGGSMGKSGSRSKSKNSYNFNQTIPGFQQNALAQLYSNAKNLYANQLPGVNHLIPGMSDQFNQMLPAATDAWGRALNGGVYDTNTINSQLTNSLDNTLNNPSNTQQIYANVMGGKGNNYADAMKASFIGDANRATDNMLANLDARAAASGMSGGSRHGVATHRGMYDINSNLQKNLADVGYNTFDKDLGNKLNIAQQADQNTLQRQQMLQQMLGSAQDTSNNAMTNTGQGIQNLGMGTFAPFMAPWTMMGNYADVIGQPTVLSSGSGTGSGSGKSKGKSGSGGI